MAQIPSLILALSLSHYSYYPLSLLPTPSTPPNLPLHQTHKRRSEFGKTKGTNNRILKMLLGKRARHPMKRTTSMTEFSYDDLSLINSAAPSSDDQNNNHHQQAVAAALAERDHRKEMSFLASPKTKTINRRNSADFALQSNSSTYFLRTCSLCNRRLAPGRDIYIYRGDNAFCSLECRQQQMTQDEWREKCTNKNKESNSSTTVSSAKGDTIVAL